MSDYDKDVVLKFAADSRNWTDSTESIQNQKSAKSVRPDSVDLLLHKSEAFKSQIGGADVLAADGALAIQRSAHNDVLYVPAKLLSGDLTVLRVTMTPPESKIQLGDRPAEKPKAPAVEMGILEIIDNSEDAPKDRVPWKYLRRPSLYNRGKNEFMVTWLRNAQYHYSQVLNRRRMNLTCLNCTSNIKTKIRHVSTIRTKRSAWILTIFGLCVLPYLLFLFKDVVHICPFCNVYLGFCPAFKYPQRADVMADVLTPISMTGINRIGKKIATTYNDTVSKVREKGRRFTMSV